MSTSTDNSSTNKPFLRFYHSEPLREKTNSALQALESDPEHKKHGVTIADLVSELVEEGMDYYFLNPLMRADVGFVAEKSARIGVASAAKLISSVSRKYITKMDYKQLTIVADHIKSLAE